MKAENPNYPNMGVLLMDTEGLGGTMENLNYDSKIFLFGLLLSSYFIYNTRGVIDENSLQDLSLAINIAKEIQSKSFSKNKEHDEIAKFFPSFLWVVRDFMLQLKDPEGNNITEKEYLENSLKPQSIDSKNKIRSLFKVNYFYLLLLIIKCIFFLILYIIIFLIILIYFIEIFLKF